MEGDGSGWVRCGRGHRHWGRYGAAGLLLADRRSDPPLILLQHRAVWTANGGTWGIPGGARDSHETPVQSALREVFEETGIPAHAVATTGEYLDDHGGGWSYTTVLAELMEPTTLVPQEESEELQWVPVDQIDQHPLTAVLHPGFAASWPRLRDRIRAR